MASAVEDFRPIRGSCLCGAVRFEITGPPLFMTRCHCSRCRKAGGGTTVSVRAEHFHWVEGEDLVVRYEPEPPYQIVRCFCGSCGTSLGEPATNDEGFPIAAHAFDDDPGVRLVLHEHVDHKPAWYEIDDDLPRYPDHVPVGGDD